MIILEGIDGVGKTTIANHLNELGFITHHFIYDQNNNDITSKYLGLLNSDTRKMILDRSFISELVYGPVLRGKSKINREQLERIVSSYQKISPILIYVKASKEDVLERRKDDNNDFNMIATYYEALNERYDKAIKVLSQYFRTFTVNTSEQTIEEVFETVEGKINGYSLCREHFER